MAKKLLNAYIEPGQYAYLQEQAQEKETGIAEVLRSLIPSKVRTFERIEVKADDTSRIE